MSHPRVVAIVQARMGSERLPGKVLLDVAGQSMLERVVRRVGRAQRIDQVVVATSTNPSDDPIEEAARALEAGVARGSEEDVLSRYVVAARDFDADVCVRVSADSPFVDPEVCDLVIAELLESRSSVDYVSNKLNPSFPLGLDVEAFTRDALERAAAAATEPFERSHVTAFIYGNPARFRLLAVETSPNLHAWRWTVDTREDLEFARAVFAVLGGSNEFSWREVVDLIRRRPDIAQINAHVSGKPLTAG